MRNLQFGALVTPLLVCRWSLADGILLVTLPLVIRVSVALAMLVCDLSRSLCRASASTSAGVCDLSDSSLLDGRGMDTKVSVLTWGLPCNELKAASLYVMGNLGLRVYDALDAAEQVLLGQLDSLSDSVDESPCDGGSQL